MKKLVFGLTLLVTLFSVSKAQKCAIGERTSEETRQCCNILRTQIEPKVLSEARGILKYPVGTAIPYALVEIFTNPHWIKKDLAMPELSQQRIIACTSNSQGYFSITGLKKGNYELRVSALGAFNVEHWYIRIDPRTGRNRKLEIYLSAGS